MAALGGEADAHQLVAGAPDAPPQPAVAAAELVIALARHRLPHADAALGAAHLQRLWLLWRGLGAPVESVAAEIHQPAAHPEMVLEGLHHPFGMIFRVLPGDHHAIGRQCRHTLVMEVMIGDDVMLHADGVQPLVDIALGDPARGAGAALDGVHQRELARPGVEHRAGLRHQRHAGAVGMVVVAGEAELRVHVRRLGQRTPGSGAGGDLGATAGAHVAAIDLVGEGRDQQHHVGARLRRTNDEGDVVLARVVLDMRGIEPARPVRRHGEREALPPAQRPLVVVMEMDGAVLGGGGFPVMHRAGPIGAGHRPGRQVDEAGVGGVRADVGGGLAAHAQAEIPLGMGGAAGAAQAGALDLAVEMRAGRGVALGRQGGEEHFGGAPRRRRGLAGGPAGVGQRRERRLGDLQPAIATDRRGQPIPAVRMQLLPHLRPLQRPIRPARLHHGAALRPDAERALPGAYLERDDPLAALARRGRPDRRGQYDATMQVRLQGGHMAETAEMRFLLQPVPRPIDRACHRHLGIARPGGIGVGAEMAHEADAERAAAGARNHETDRAALLGAPAISVSGEGMHRRSPRA